ncbi:MAG: hypothetical protein J0I54_17765 [Bosea sp.]|uniref:hypothetical protein n=1 Tax=unclassified Bosea (in: a-proteobacteria) TaxID=2653178 RepID=UPI00096753E1|nr:MULTISPECIES: hypothetical protein [unclassified Bosea (in: a-proteobacteria)]MBN9458481.1 hypothetical protein [Bosea sp. (in: a-proteobacteria)]OJV06817.1 MAG: hypothetical protein BGO20_00180 [Bosea sp. 67-29]
MQGIFLGDRRIGTVAKFVGNRPGERWVAWSIHRPAGAPPHAEGEQRRFPRQREAMAWLRARDEQEQR